MKITTICLSLLVLVSCQTTIPLKQGKTVRRYYKTEPRGRCKHVGDIDFICGSDTLFWFSQCKMRQAENKLRNEAAKLGGNAVSVDRMAKLHDDILYEVSGRAYKCK